MCVTNAKHVYLVHGREIFRAKDGLLQAFAAYRTTNQTSIVSPYRIVGLQRLVTDETLCSMQNVSDGSDAHPEIGRFSPPFGCYFLTKLYRSLDKKVKIQWRKFKKKSSGGSAPKLQISVPCRGRTPPENYNLIKLSKYLQGSPLCTHCKHRTPHLKRSRTCRERNVGPKFFGTRSFFWTKFVDVRTQALASPRFQGPARSC